MPNAIVGLFTNFTTVKQHPLGMKSLSAVAIGLVVSQGVMVLMLQGAGIAGLSFLIPLAMAWVLALCYVATFSELSLMIPQKGTLSAYSEVALGQFPAIMSVYSGYVITGMFALPAELMLVNYLLGELYPALADTQYVMFGILGLFAVLNLMGVNVFAKLQNVLAFIMVVALLLLGLGAISGSFAPHVFSTSELVANFGLGEGTFALVALGIWGFVGAEFVCPLVGEARNPTKHIPRAMYLGVTAIFVIIAIYCVGALYYVPQDILATDPLPHFAFASAAFGGSGTLLLAIAAITATCSTINTSFAAVPRMLQGMAEHNQTFSCFAWTNGKRNVPWVAVLFIAAISVLPLLVWGDDPSAVGLLLVSAAIAWLIAYIIAHVSVIALRRRYPQLQRPYRTPFYPIPQLLGIVGMVFAIFYASPAPEVSAQIFTNAGVVIGVMSLVAVVWIKLVMHKPLFKPEPLKPNNIDG